MWRIRQDTYFANLKHKKLSNEALRNTIMKEIGTDKRTYIANRKALIKLKWIVTKGKNKAGKDIFYQDKKRTSFKNTIALMCCNSKWSDKKHIIDYPARVKYYNKIISDQKLINALFMRDVKDAKEHRLRIEKAINNINTQLFRLELVSID